jgi:hypothetical protein
MKTTKPLLWPRQAGQLLFLFALGLVYGSYAQSNSPPIVHITVPSNGSVFYTPADISICANAYDPEGYVATVEFFAGTNSLGVTTNNPASAGARNPFCLVLEQRPSRHVRPDRQGDG